MRKWKYHMDVYGKSIRQVINSGEETIENVIEIYDKIIIFLNAWHKKLNESDKEAVEYDIKSLIEDLECARPNIDEEDYESKEDTLNCYLNEFYDLCDRGSCWIGI